jgi:hypothetical protein
MRRATYSCLNYYENKSPNKIIVSPNEPSLMTTPVSVADVNCDVEICMLGACVLKFPKTLGSGLHESLISTVPSFIKFHFLLHCKNQNCTIHVKMLKEIQDLNQYIIQQMQLIKHNSWQVSNAYMSRHRSAILRKYSGTNEYKSSELNDVLNRPHWSKKILKF